MITRRRTRITPTRARLVRWGPQTFDEMMIGYIDIDLPRGVSPVRRARPKGRAVRLEPRKRSGRPAGPC